MTAVRTFARSAAVLGAATALTVAGAGAAMATTHNYEVVGNDVSVTFTLEEGEVLNFCGAAITQVADAASVAAEFAGAVNEGSLLRILRTLNNNDSITVLKRDGLLIDTSVVALTPRVLGVGNPSDSVHVEDLPSNVYALVSVCTDEPTKPVINPFVLVGGPVEAIMGSVDSLSAGGDGLNTLSSIIDGDDDSGLGGVLSSALGGGEGDLLGTLSSAAGDAQ